VFNCSFYWRIGIKQPKYTTWISDR